MTEYNKYGDPLFEQNKRMKEIDEIIEPLDEELYKLRKENYCLWGKPEIVDRIRELRKELGILDKEYWDISKIVNKEWHNQAPVWKKQFSQNCKSKKHNTL